MTTATDNNATPVNADHDEFTTLWALRDHEPARTVALTAEQARHVAEHVRNEAQDEIEQIGGDVTPERFTAVRGAMRVYEDALDQVEWDEPSGEVALCLPGVYLQRLGRRLMGTGACGANSARRDGDWLECRDELRVAAAGAAIFDQLGVTR